MNTATQKRLALRRLLDRPGIAVAPGCGEALGGVLIEEAGFEAAYMSGYAVEATYGHPDVGLLNLVEMAGRAGEICDVTSIPLIADADTGYGSAINVNRTVRQFERAGVAAIQVEDQVISKKCGSMAGKRLVTVDEMVGKIKAAVDARMDENFQIIARTDVMALEGLNAVVDRLGAFHEAGADMLMALGPYTQEQAAHFVKHAKGRVAYLNSETFTMPMLPSDQLEAMGVKLVILPLALTLAKAHAMRETLKVIRGNKADTREHAARSMTSWADCNKLLGLPEIERIETEFGI